MPAPAGAAPGPGGALEPGSEDDHSQRTQLAPATAVAPATTKAAAPTQLANIPRLQATQKKPLDPGLKLVFIPGTQALPATEQMKLAMAAAKAGLPSGARVTLLLGPAKAETSLEGLSLARHRGETVATLLPQGLDIVQDYRPDLPADVVWVVFGERYASDVPK